MNSRQAERSAVPPGQEVRWTKRTGAWIGIGTGPAVLMAGGAMAARTGGSLALAGVAVGGVALFLLCVLHSLCAQRSRMRAGQMVRDVFSDRWGPPLLVGALVVATAGWCGFYIGLGGAAVSDLLGSPQLVGAAIVSAVVAALALQGQDTWNSLVYLTATCSVALTVFTVAAVDPAPVVIDSAPVIPGLVEASGGIIVYGIVFAMRAPDFTADVSSPRGVWLAGLTMLLPLLALAGLGVWLHERTGLSNMADLLESTARPEAGQLFLVLSAIAPATSALYSCAVSIDALRHVQHRTTMLVFSAVAFVLGSFRFDRHLIDFFEVLSIAIPPALTVIIVHMYTRLRPPRPQATVAWLLGSTAALAIGRGARLGSLVLGCVVTFGWMSIASILARRAHEIA